MAFSITDLCTFKNNKIKYTILDVNITKIIEDSLNILSEEAILELKKSIGSRHDAIILKRSANRIEYVFKDKDHKNVCSKINNL